MRKKESKTAKEQIAILEEAKIAIKNYDEKKMSDILKTQKSMTYNDYTFLSRNKNNILASVIERFLSNVYGMIAGMNRFMEDENHNDDEKTIVKCDMIKYKRIYIDHIDYLIKLYTKYYYIIGNDARYDIKNMKIGEFYELCDIVFMLDHTKICNHYNSYSSAICNNSECILKLIRGINISRIENILCSGPREPHIPGLLSEAPQGTNIFEYI